MKVRIKFAKRGVMKFIGHLDVMRYFQKVIRRAQIDIKFTEGFSPHMVMSFAAPLGVGLTSDGEYMDIEVNSPISSREALRRLNECMVEGMEVKSFRRISKEKASNAMALVAAADYLVSFREGCDRPERLAEDIKKFYGQDTIKIVKRTKKSEKEVDIKPMMLSMEAKDDRVFMRLASGSVNNLKPELVTEALFAYLGKEFDPFKIMVHRLEIYAESGREQGGGLVSLEELGEEMAEELVEELAEETAEEMAEEIAEELAE